MPTNKNAMTRYKLLDELLSDRYHEYTIADLTEKVNDKLVDMGISPVTRRCIELDITYIEYGPFMADIDRKSVGGHKTIVRYANPSFSIFSKQLSSDEEHLLYEALSLLGQFDGLPNLEALDGLRMGFGVREDKHKIISFTKNSLENKTLIGQLFTSISHRQVVKLRFHVFASPDEKRVATVHPYLLKEYNRRWYLLSATEPDMRMFTFSLDRIDEVIPQPAFKYKPYDGDIDEWFDDIIGITLIKSNPVRRITFFVSDASASYVATKPLHDSQIHIRGSRESELRSQYPMLRGGAFFSIDCRENYELIRELSSFGDALRVLSPKDIQDKLYARARSIIDGYDAIRS